eukprot:TRINITY_DN26368_c0_g1_i1.p1 TRINITY_DN26368_c0_g1~~TRINITY_DN26368_c0_g1_i1.p1  ORF type:complete len:949 (-),score=254.08 TRINITY_DN26368_c0_g1_i1:150-2954(-)
MALNHTLLNSSLCQNHSLRGCAHHEVLSESTSHGWIYVAEILVVIGLSLAFEKGQDALQERFDKMGKRGEKMTRMKQALYKEIMILGFISLCVFMMIKSGVAMQIARQIFPREETKGESDPLAETFENIHMIIFAIMVVFIMHCALLVYSAQVQFEKWARWEHCTVYGKSADGHTTMESQLRDLGVIETGSDGQLRSVCPLKMERNPARRLFQQGGIRELLQWRAIRHEFMFPAPPVASAWASNGLTPRSASDACISRVPLVGEQVLSNTGARTARSAEGVEDGWTLHAGEAATVVDVDEDGDFKLQNRDGVVSAWLYRFGYSYANSVGANSNGTPPEAEARTVRTPRQSEGRAVWDGSTLQPVREPHLFHFHEYLAEKLGELFVELVEVDISTWILAAFATLLLPFALETSGKSLPMLLAACSWTLVVITLFFGMHVYQMYLAVTPEFPDMDPLAVMHQFEGTSAIALKRHKRHHKAHGSHGHGHAHPAQPQPAAKEDKPTPSPLTVTVTKAESNGPSFPGRWNSDSLTTTNLMSTPGRWDSVDSTSKSQLALPLLLGSTGGRTPNNNGSHCGSPCGLYGPSQELSQARFRLAAASQRQQWLQDSKQWGARYSSQRPFYMKWVGADPAYAPNDQERLFFFHEKGPEIYSAFLEAVMFFQAVTVAMYIVTWFTTREDWDMQMTALFMLGLAGPLFNLWWLVPKIVAKLAIVTSVEDMKDDKIIQRVTFETKRRQMLESLKLLQIVKLQGRIERLGGDVISDQEFLKARRDFELFSRRKQEDIVRVFRMFDADNSGSIDLQEMHNILYSLGIHSNTDDAHWSTIHLMRLVDRDASGDIDLTEFKVLMALALLKPNKDEELSDLKTLFRTFDHEDGDGTVTLKELTTKFIELGVDVEEDDIASLILQVFGVPRGALQEKDFVAFIMRLEQLNEMSE